MLPVAVAVGADLHRPGSSSRLVSPSLGGQSPIQTIMTAVTRQSRQWHWCCHTTNSVSPSTPQYPLPLGCSHHPETSMAWIWVRGVLSMLWQSEATLSWELAKSWHWQCISINICYQSQPSHVTTVHGTEEHSMYTQIQSYFIMLG